MSEQIFAQFPATGGDGAYHLIDVTRIEAIGQSSVREVGIIFGPTDRYYSVEIPTQALDEGNFPDAATYCYQIMENAWRDTLTDEMRPPEFGQGE